MESMTAWAGPLWAWVAPAIPQVLSVVAITVAAFVGARLAHLAAKRLAAMARLEERLRSPGLSATAARLAGALVWLLALPALLGALRLEALLVPVNAMMTQLLGFVPRLFGTAVVLGIGLLLASVVRQIVAGVLRAAGSERLAQRIGLSTALGDGGLSGALGHAVFGLIMLPVVAAALQPLGLDSVTQPVSRLVETVMQLIPRLFAAALIVGLAAVIGRAVAGLVSALLQGFGVDALPQRLGIAPDPAPGRRHVSDWMGSLAMWAIVYLAFTQATEVIGLPVLTQAVAAAGSALVQIALGLAVLVAGLWAGTALREAVQGSGLRHARRLGQIARFGVVFFAVALALRQAGLPAEIVNIAFGAVAGGLALGAALAIGLGGQGVAARWLARASDAMDPGASPAPGSTLAARAPVAAAVAAPVPNAGDPPPSRGDA